MFRLRTKEPASADAPAPPPDPRTLIDAQSVIGATAAAVAVMILLCSVWVYVAVVSGRVLPWFSIIQGVFLGLAVRRFGRGLDWRFPLIAAVSALIGAFLGNLLVAVPTTSSTLGASATEVVFGLTWWSFETFFAEVITVVDYIYAFCAMAVAMFYSKRQLNRHEEFALRTRERP